MSMQLFEISVEFSSPPSLGYAARNRTVQSIPSDRLFSWISLGWIRLFGIKDYQHVAQKFVNGKPLWRHSDLFPFHEENIWLPPPRWTPEPSARKSARITPAQRTARRLDLSVSDTSDIAVSAPEEQSADGSSQLAPMEAQGAAPEPVPSDGIDYGGGLEAVEGVEVGLLSSEFMAIASDDAIPDSQSTHAAEGSDRLQREEDAISRGAHTSACPESHSSEENADAPEAHSSEVPESEPREEEAVALEAYASEGSESESREEEAIALEAYASEGSESESREEEAIALEAYLSEGSESESREEEAIAHGAHASACPESESREDEAVAPEAHSSEVPQSESREEEAIARGAHASACSDISAGAAAPAGSEPTESTALPQPDPNQSEDVRRGRRQTRPVQVQDREKGEPGIGTRTVVDKVTLSDTGPLAGNELFEDRTLVRANAWLAAVFEGRPVRKNDLAKTDEHSDMSAVGQYNGWLLTADSSVVEKLSASLEFMAEEGLGSGRSAGRGIIRSASIKESQGYELLLPSGRRKISRHLILSACCPTSEFIEAVESSPPASNNYALSFSSGWIYDEEGAATDLRKPVTCAFETGSVFSVKPEGKLLEVGNEEHPSYRYGFPFIVSV
jgi:CRISPR/Cas system CSM-associated protein Csm4 (group 5 of RAMP superfamily)